jgi:hypothetical protein
MGKLEKGLEPINPFALSALSIELMPPASANYREEGKSPGTNIALEIIALLEKRHLTLADTYATDN